MSLINDALKDLEQRERKTTLDIDGTISNNAPEVEKTGWRRFVVGSVVGAAVLVLLYQGILLFELKIAGQGAVSDTQAIELINTPVDAPAVEKEQGAMVKRHVIAAARRKAHAERKKSASLVTHASKPPPDKPNTLKIDPAPTTPKEQAQKTPDQRLALNKAESIKTLLGLASESIAVNRLTRPEGKSALYYYQQVLQHDPGNEHANTGIAVIRRQYLALLNDEVANKRQARAHQLFLRLHLVDDNDDLLASYQQKIAAIYKAPNDHARALTGGRDKAILPDPENTKRRVAKRTIEGMPENMTIAQSSQTQDNILFQQASDLVTNNQTTQAIMLLEKSCRRHSYCDKSLVYQFDLYLQNDRYIDAKTLATQLENQPKTTGIRHAALPYMQAKLANYTHGAIEAIAILEDSPAREPYLEEQLRLLAALYQSEKQYPKAYALYKRLVVDSDYGNDNDVLGLAVSADMLGKREQAYLLYQRLQGSQTHSGAVGKFITERISVLSDVSLAQQP